MTENRSTAISGSHDLTDEVARSGAANRAGLDPDRARDRSSGARPAPARACADARSDAGDGLVRRPRAVLVSARPHGELRARADGVRLRARARPARAGFTCRDPYGRAMELVTMRDGGGFDLLGGF